VPVSKHRKRKKSKSAGRKGDFVMVQHPLSKVPHDALIKGLAEVGHAFKQDFPKLLSEVTEIVNSVDKLHIITALSTYGLFAGASDKGISSILDRPFNQAHVELIQALALQAPEEADTHRPPSPEQIQQLFDKLPEVAEAFSLQRLIEVEKERNENEKGLMLLQEHLRQHTQSVRNWGYFHRVIEIIKRLYEPINPIFRKKIGLNAVELINLFEWLTRRVENKVNDRWQLLKEVYAAGRLELAVEIYLHNSPHIDNSAESIMTFLKERNCSFQHFISLCMSHSELKLTSDLVFTPEDVSTALGYPVEITVEALQRLSMKFGELATSNPEYFFLNNPIWIKPLIELSTGEYFCATPQVFFSFVFPIFDELLGDDAQAIEEYSKRRSEFLEDEIERLFKSSFPECESERSYKWRDEKKLFENDLLVKVDSHLFIVEAKSGAVSWKALRGTPERMKKHAEELLIEPSIQSHRLYERTLFVLKNPEQQEKLLPKFPFSLDEIQTVLRLSVTLEDFATLQSNLHMVKATGWIPEDHPLAACILLADLEVVMDILETTPQKIHYLKRRSELEANMNYLGDELDLLGFYLKTGFNIGNAEYNGQQFILTGLSKDIDKYYMAADEAIRIKKPSCKLTTWWSDICHRLEQRSFHQWSDIANILLRFSFDEQQQVEKKFNKIKKNVQKNWRIDGHVCSIVVIPNQWRSDALVVYAFKENQKSERHERMRNVASHAFESAHVKRCLVMAINIDKEQYPYSTLGVFFPGQNQEEPKANQAETTNAV